MCVILLWYYDKFILDSFDTFTHIRQDCFTGTGAVAVHVKQYWRICVKSADAKAMKKDALYKHSSHDVLHTYPEAQANTSHNGLNDPKSI